MNADVTAIAALAVSVLSVGGAFVAYGKLQQRMATAEKQIDKLDAEKASKESLGGLREFLEERFRSLEQRIERLMGREDTRP